MKNGANKKAQLKQRLEEKEMKKVFILEDLDCANCAAKMEKDVAKLDGVHSASVALMSQKMVLDIDESLAPTIFDTVKKIVNKYEPDVVVKEK